MFGEAKDRINARPRNAFGRVVLGETSAFFYPQLLFRARSSQRAVLSFNGLIVMWRTDVHAKSTVRHCGYWV